MDELSNKYTYDAKYQEKRNTPIKTLMELHLQNNVISYTLKYIFSIDEKPTKQRKAMWRLNHLKSGTCPNQLYYGIS